MANMIDIPVNTASDEMVPPKHARENNEDNNARRHALALQYTGVVTWEWDLLTDLVTTDEGFHSLFCINENIDITGSVILSLIHAEDLPKLQEALQRCYDNIDGLYNCRFRIPDGTGEWRWLQGKGQVAGRDLEGNVTRLIGINYDQTETVKREERLGAIAGEMRHRVKNSLAMVNALASATAREATGIEDFISHFRGRVDAIAAAQRLMDSDGDSDEISCTIAINAGLSPFISSREWAQRITIQSTTENTISFSLGQAITLATYEFATNAVKYGALSDDPGTIAVSIAEANDMLVISWLETFSDDATIKAETAGFGSTLINRLVRAEHGHIKRELTAERLYIELSFPLTY